MKKITLLFTVLMSTFIYSQNFSDHQIDSTTADALSVKIADLDEDGDLDIIAAFYNEPATTSTGKLIWYENDGAQNYTQHLIDTNINGALYIDVKDITGDGHLDVLLNAYDGNALYVFINTSIAPVTFDPKLAIDSVANGSNYSSAADFDGDSLIDVISANYSSGELAWYKNDSSGTSFTKNVISPAVSLVSSVEIGDMDGDGNIDLVVTGDDQIYWYANDGAGNFTQQSISSSTGFTGAISAYMIDFDADGDIDIIGTASGAEEVAWFENDGSQTFTKHLVATGVAYASFAQAADFNNDGNMDIVVSATNADKLYYYENDGTNTSFVFHLVLNGNPLGDSYAIDLADIDGDGDIDIALTSPGPNILRWLQNDFIGAPANDLCGDAFPVTCGDSLIGTTANATGGSSTSCQGSLGNDVWYKFVGDGSRVSFEINSTTSDEEAQVDVYASSDGTCTGFTQGDCDGSLVQSTGGDNPYTATFDSVVGTTYFIAVGNWINGNPAFDFTLDITCITCVEVINIATDNFTSQGEVDLSWDAVSGVLGYNWEIQPQGTAQGGATPIQSGYVTTNAANAATLTEGDNYTLYVQTVCSTTDSSLYASYDFTFVLPPPNDDCSSATVIACGSNLTGETTAGASDNGDDVGCTQGMGVWYKFVGNDNTVTIDVTNPSFDVEIGVASSSDCTTFTNVDCKDSSTGDETVSFDADLGTDYFIYIAHYIDTSTITGTFDIAVSCVPYPTCPDPSDLTITNITETTAEFNLTENGSATVWDLEIVIAGNSPTGTPTEDNITLPYTTWTGTPSTSYDVYYRTDCGGDNSSDVSNWVGPVNFYTGYCQPEITTSSLTYIDTFSTTNGFTNIDNPSTGFSTNNYGDYFDTLSVSLHDNESFDFNVEIEGGTVGCAIWIDWNNDLVFDIATETVFQNGEYSNGPFTGTISIPPGTAEGEYRLRIMIDWLDEIIDDDACTFNGAGGEVEDYKVIIDNTLATQNLASVGFEYYPNPVNSKLTVKANKNITSIAIFNMLGQQVKQVNPSSLNATINISSLANGTYFMKATVGEKVGTFKIIKK